MIMAVVKFISENDCRLFVDMNYVGDILANKMLRITLEAGSYLVEIKDSSDNILKKYELKISPGDAQVLQNITQESNSIEDSINKLMDDPSLRFYNQRALIKHNDLYGYINSQYKLVISPIYSYAEDFIQEKALVKKLFSDREMATIIDTNGNICFGQWFEYVGSDINTILLKDNKRYIVISRNDYSIQNEFIDAGYDGKGQLIPVYKEIGVDDMYGYIDKVGKETIPLIYDYAWNFESSGYAKVKRFGQEHAVDVYGNLYRNMPPSQDLNGNIDMFTKEESICNDFGEYVGEERPIKEGHYWGIGGIEIIENDDWTQKIVKTNKINSYRCDRILYYEWGLMDIEILAYRIGSDCTLVVEDRTTGKNDSYTYKAESIEPIIEMEMYYESIINTLIIRNKRKYGIAQINGEMLLPTEYDSIIPIMVDEEAADPSYKTTKVVGYIIKKGGKYGIANCKGKIVVPLEQESISQTEIQRHWETGNYCKIWQNGKCNLFCISSEKILFPSIYDNIITMGSIAGDSVLLLKKKEKLGCFTFDEGEILDCLYDNINVKGGCNEDSKRYFIILTKNKKKGVYEYCDSSNYGKYEFYVTPLYDECVFLKNQQAVANYCGMYYVAVRLNEKWGILDVEPAWATYFPEARSEWHNCPNLKDLEFKYSSLEELKKDADAEFKRRFDKYYREHLTIVRGDGSLIINTID